ncbi:MAG: glycoside hydrolase family 97 N-terminal domain-containing protein [Acidobacteria bacterium]|nr:glycoside hydrolase family 97 N-terminal domain-containing protein [Acidobacteriota bacterium]MBI3279665.1 glycoside hydrolase family 97 N-terminal domain-containing protein [Acidobacteriota bacterium]
MHMRMIAAWLLLPAAVAFAGVPVTSPGGKVRFTLAVEDGRLSYQVARNGSAVIEPSPLGIVVDGVNLAEGVETGKAAAYRVNTTYPWHGVHSVAADRCNGVRIPIKHLKSGAAYTLEVRAYDDGVAFRFTVPGREGERRTPDEATVFRIPAGSTVWYHDFEGHYEGIHAKRTIEDVKAGDWAAPPLTIRLPGNSGYAAITEGALLRYSGMGLQADGRGGFAARLGHAHPPSYPFRLRYASDVQRMSEPAVVAGAITTPWRIIMSGPDLNTLVNCDIVHNVAPPPGRKLFPKGAKTAWIKPGRAVWRYLDGGETTLAGMKEFSRLAGELGFEYNVIEGFWQKWSEQELKDLVDTSRRYGVGIILWKHSRDLRDAAARRKFFELCSRAGVAGAKIDFFDHEHKDVVELYEACLREAAEFRQVVNFHGANKPSGESRTWPNELTREAIKGMEGRRVPRARHDATLPFTRMLAGHADYTPLLFSERRADTTWAHQVASAAIYTSPLLVYGAHPKTMLENPAAGIIKSIPSVWDETIALPVSEIGEVAAFARRRGDRWFVAVMNGPDARAIDVPLAFLGAGKYHAELIRDDPQRTDAVKVEQGAAARGESLRIELAPGGGFVARFSK